MVSTLVRSKLKILRTVLPRWWKVGITSVDFKMWPISLFPNIYLLPSIQKQMPIVQSGAALRILILEYVRSRENFGGSLQNFAKVYLSTIYWTVMPRIEIGYRSGKASPKSIVTKRRAFREANFTQNGQSGPTFISRNLMLSVWLLVWLLQQKLFLMYLDTFSSKIS